MSAATTFNNTRLNDGKSSDLHEILHLGYSLSPPGPTGAAVHERGRENFSLTARFPAGIRGSTNMMNM
jgi:hypothetical protein